MEECVEESVKSVELWLSIPLQNSDHCVSLSLSSLLGSVGESEAANEGYIVDVLAGELAPLRLWLRVAIEFLRKNRSNSFENILRLILNQDLDQLFTEQSAISERILIINALASSYTMIAFQAVEQETKQQFMQAAMKLFADADRISSTDPGTWVGKGIMYILEGNLDRALQRFEQFISVAKDRNPIAAKLGKAMVAYYKTEYKEALEIYQGILENHPTCPAIVRLGIGMCAYQLNDMDLSKEAFERVLQLDPENPHAALGMYAVLYWEAIQKESSMEKALAYLKIAYSFAPRNPAICTALSEHEFFNCNMEKAAALCEKAVQLHQYNSSQIRALSFFQIGRIHHIEGNMEEAFNNYQNAFFLWGDNSNILFGLGQAYIYKGKLQEAKRCFERLKERFPENFHVLRILGSICRSLSDFDSAKELLIKALRIQPNYEQLAIETAQLCEITGDYGIALSIYQTIIQNSNDEPSYQLLNNVAVLLHLTSQFEKAREMYESANSAFTKQNNDENLFHPTLLFNQAFLLESQGEVQLAISNYNDLIAKCKLQGFSYIDASLRLAYLQMDSVNFTEAKKVLESISRTAEGKIPSTLILGQIAVAEDDLGLAQKLFEESVALAKFSEFQDYAELSLASILIAQFQKNRKSSNPEKQAEIKAWIKQADELYREILKRSPSNVYAANGLGVCFAAKHDHDAAYQIFTAIREQAPEMPNVYINLGHSALKRQSIQSALNFYENCSKKFFNGQNCKVLRYLGRAYFLLGEFCNAKNIFEDIMKLEPEPETKYNLALCIEQKALSLLNKVKGRFLAVNENSLNLVQGARRDLDDVIAMYKNLAGDDLAPSYVKKLAMTRQKIVTKQLGFGDENVKRFVKEYEKVQKSLSKMTDLAESKRKEMEAEIKRIEEEKKRQILEEAARAEEASKALVNNVKGNLELSLTTKKRRPRDADAEGSDSDVEETEDAISRNPKKLKRSKKESASLKSVDSQEMHDTAIEALPVKKQMRKKALADLSSSEDDLDKDQILAPSPEIEDDN